MLTQIQQQQKQQEDNMQIMDEEIQQKRE